MSLTDHARAARILADAFDHYGKQDENTLLMRMADVYRDAAEMMDDADREAMRQLAADHACTIDHATMPTLKCVACGAPRR